MNAFLRTLTNRKMRLPMLSIGAWTQAPNKPVGKKTDRPTPLKRVLGSLLLMLMGWLWLSNPANAQIYKGNYSTTLKYYDIASNTWTTKANAPSNFYNLTVFQGKIYAAGSSTSDLYVYDPTTNTWATKTTSMIMSNSFLVTAGNYIYIGSFGNSNFFRYDPVTGTSTTLAPFNVSSSNYQFVYDGGNYIYGCSMGANTSDGFLGRYDISANTWTTLPKPPNGSLALAYKNGKLYAGSLYSYSTTLSARFFVFDIATSTYSTSLVEPSGGASSLIGDNGNNLYASTYNGDLPKYDITTNTWVVLTNDVTRGPLVYLPSCSPTGTVATTQATCGTAGGVNADAKLTLTAFSGAAKVGYSTGSSYTGPAFSAAAALTTAPMDLATTLANPTVDQPYTIRVFGTATCYQDYVVTLQPKLCITGDLSLSLSPTQLSGAKGETVSYTLTLTNAGPDAMPGVAVKIPIPTNVTLLNASAQQGSYSSGTQKWEVGTMPVGNKTITVTLKLN